MAIDREFLDPEVRALVDEICRQFGERIDTILLYGSWRRGRRDTMPDFYVLLDRYPTRWWSWPSRLLLPTVVVHMAGGLRAKVAVLTTTQLHNALKRDFHSYFWARFAQPMPLVFARDERAGKLAGDLRRLAQKRLIDSVRECWPPGALPLPSIFWQHTFRLTYSTELRAEKTEKIDELYLVDAEEYDAIYTTFTAMPARTRYSAARARLGWRCRQVVGKVLSAFRLLKSTLTFDDPLTYLAWKVGRQSGVSVEPSERARRWPLLFGWVYVWRLYRLGAFR